MNELVLSIILLFVGLTISRAWKATKYKNMLEESNKRVQFCESQLLKNLLCDLELATTEQLTEEMRKRTTPYVLLFPQESKDRLGIKIEASKVPPVLAVQFLALAATQILKNLSESGVEVPGVNIVIDEKGVGDESVGN